MLRDDIMSKMLFILINPLSVRHPDRVLLRLSEYLTIFVIFLRARVIPNYWVSTIAILVSILAKELVQSANDMVKKR